MDCECRHYGALQGLDKKQTVAKFGTDQVYSHACMHVNMYGMYITLYCLTMYVCKFQFQGCLSYTHIHSFRHIFSFYQTKSKGESINECVL